MFKEALARVAYLFKSSDHWSKLESEAYHRGLSEGQDFGERVAHNRTLVVELPRILSRYSQLQIRIMNKRPTEIKRELEKFTEREIDKLKMELQDR